MIQTIMNPRATTLIASATSGTSDEEVAYIRVRLKATHESGRPTPAERGAVKINLGMTAIIRVLHSKLTMPRTIPALAIPADPVC